MQLDYEYKDFHERSERMILTVEGEQRAKEVTDKIEPVEKVFASNSVRAIATVKYIAHKNNLPVTVDNNINELSRGVLDKLKMAKLSDFPSDFYFKQFNDDNYKPEEGESINEGKARVSKTLAELLDSKYKKIALGVHGVYIMCFLKQVGCVVKFGDINKDEAMFTVTLNDKVVYEGGLSDNPEIFKLVFAGDKVKTIESFIDKGLNLESAKKS